MALIAAFVVPHPPIIVPEIGRGEEAAASATVDAMHAFAQKIAELNADALIIVSPHAPTFMDQFFVDLREGEQEDSFAAFGHANIKLNFSVDNTLAHNIIQHAKTYDLSFVPEPEALSLAARHDHGSMVPLYFIARAEQTALGDESRNDLLHGGRGAKTRLHLDLPVVRLSFSGLDAGSHFTYGSAIAEVLEKEDKRVVFIASGDLSHKLKEEGPYGYIAEGPQFDEEVSAILKSGEVRRFLNFDEAFSDRAAECGLRSFQILAGLLDQKKWTSELLSYEGPFGVGYAVAEFLPAEKSPENHEFPKILTEDPYPALARRSLEHYVLHGQALEMKKSERDALPIEMLERQAAVFVTLHMGGDLRGCIGTLEPTTGSLAAEIVQNAISAGTTDPRFPKVTQDELPLLEYSVDVLGPMEPVDNRSQLDAQRYGVVVSQGWRRGLLLPALEGVDTVEEQIEIACMKAGISPTSHFLMERFEVIRHEGLPAEDKEF